MLPASQTIEIQPIDFAAAGDNALYTPSNDTSYSYIQQIAILPEDTVTMTFFAEDAASNQRQLTGPMTYSPGQGFVFEFFNQNQPWFIRLRPGERLIVNTSAAVQCGGFLQAAQRGV